MGGVPGRIGLGIATGGLSEAGGLRFGAQLATSRGFSHLGEDPVDALGDLLPKPTIDTSTGDKPPPPPDLTDEAVQRARMAALSRLGGAGISSTFLTGPLGAGGSSIGAQPKLSGGK